MVEFLKFVYSKFTIQVLKIAHFEQTLYQNHQIEVQSSNSFEMNINESNHDSLHSNLAQIIHVRPYDEN